MLNYKRFYFLLITLTFQLNAIAASNSIEQLTNKSWFSGAEHCELDNSPPIEVYQYNQDTFILRQNKCIHYEAPFMYLLFGEKRALLIDTGATSDKIKFPLASIVNEIMVKRASNLKLKESSLPLFVSHSHSHGDHIAGDSQFVHIKGVEISKVNDTAALILTYSFDAWPTQSAQIDLGGRIVDVIPTPGHQEQAITFYDKKNAWLLTGDSLYPGRLYIKNWLEYKESIKRIVNFTFNHPVSAILGAHIEMSNSPNVDYPVGSKYHNDEASLVLTIKDLYKLHEQLNTLGEKPTLVKLGNLIIYPVE